MSIASQSIKILSGCCGSLRSNRLADGTCLALSGRIVAILAAVTLLVACLPVSSWAESVTTDDHGAASSGVSLVVFPGKTLLPMDPDGDGLYEDVNGNGMLDFEDVVTYYKNMGWIRENATAGIAPFDYNRNGAIDFADVVLLFDARMGSRAFPPVAGFSANVTSGHLPLAVLFTDQSKGNVSAWAWDFDGDGAMDSAARSPSHLYTVAGTYAVSLAVTGPGGSDAEVKAGYIQVLPPYLEVFPGKTMLPRDLDGDGRYEDINGNGRIDSDDVITYCMNLDWMRENAAVEPFPYDYNGNWAIDFDDLLILYGMLPG
jgi:PKD repeat protein